MGEAISMGHDVCPACGEVLDMASAIQDGTKPKPLDICVCIHCANVNQYSEDFSLQRLPKVVLESYDKALQAHIIHIQIGILLTKYRMLTQG